MACWRNGYESECYRRELVRGVLVFTINTNTSCNSRSRPDDPMSGFYCCLDDLRLSSNTLFRTLAHWFRQDEERQSPTSRVAPNECRIDLESPPQAPTPDESSNVNNEDPSNMAYDCAQGCCCLTRRTRDTAYYGYHSLERAIDKIPTRHKKQASRLFTCTSRCWLVGDVASDVSVVFAIDRSKYPITFRTAIAFIVLPYVGLLATFSVPLYRRRRQRHADNSRLRNIFVLVYALLGLPAMITVDLSLAVRYCWVDFDNASSSDLWPLGSTSSRDLLLLYERARRVTEALFESILQTCLQMYLFSEKEADQLTLTIALCFSVVNVLMIVLHLHWDAQSKNKSFGQSLMGALRLGLGYDIAATRDYAANEVSFHGEALTSDELERISDRVARSGEVNSLVLSECKIPGESSATMSVLLPLFFCDPYPKFSFQFLPKYPSRSRFGDVQVTSGPSAASLGSHTSIFTNANCLPVHPVQCTKSLIPQAILSWFVQR